MLRSRYDCCTGKLKQCSEKISTFNLEGGAEQQEVFHSLNTIISRAHWIYGISKIVLEFMTAYLLRPTLS